ncbi:MAG: anti-sigma factor domain-containing protein [Marmoricola sp.]
MTAHEIHALSGAYAVDALDDVERARFEEHLAACAECRAEVASLKDAAAAFSAMAPAQVPAALRAKVLADIKAVRPLPPVVARLEARRPRRWANLVAAAAVLGVLGGGVAVWQQTHDTTSRAPMTAAEQIRAAGDVTSVTKDLGDGARATIYRSESLGKAAVVTSHLPALPAGKIYQLWLQDPAGHMIDAGPLTDPRRATVLRGDASDATGVGITVEPAGGSHTPTIPVFALIDLEQAT